MGSQYNRFGDLIRTGSFTLHSGQSSDFKIDCDALNIREIRSVAYLLAQRLPPFKLAIGIPTGGNRLAQEMQKYYKKDPEAKILLVDDVYTTGKSLQAMREEIPSAIGCCIFARSMPPAWITPLFVMTPPNPEVVFASTGGENR